MSAYGVSAPSVPVIAVDARKRANLRVLQRIDSSIVDIIGSATHVVLYQFHDTHQQWEKCNVEGSLFVVKRDMSSAASTNERATSPASVRFKLIILNRNSTENLEVCITVGFQMQLREPYLIFRDSTSSSKKNGGGAIIRGIWFHSADERAAVSSLLDRVVRSQAHVADLEEKHSKDSPTANEVVTEEMTDENATTGNNNSGKREQHAVHTISSSSQAGVAGGFVPTTPNNSNNVATTNVAFESGVDAGAAAAALLSPLSLSGASTLLDQSDQQQQQQQQQVKPQHRPQQNVILDKKTLQLTLLSLIQDERFLDLIHAQYLKVAHARAKNATDKTGKK
mmetsp:Transcript_51664/g.76567  ORF Transcript_51664/g.76567 Transcript_51664/m.76567 type:complete len:338 (+) Transcript_51664:105-1118(+)